jgi:hypothetical protein
MTYTGLLIADQHFGAGDTDHLVLEHISSLLEYMDSLKKIDYMIILGDYFDHKMYLNDSDAWAAFKIMEEIISRIKKNEAKLRIVYGTASHENNQYNIFNTLFRDTTLDVRVIKTVEEEQLFEGLKVLYLPEEYIYNKNEYYNDYFTKLGEYDYVFGHGIIQEVMTDACRHTSKETKRAKVPVFSSAELKRLVKGEVYFGHYHINSTVDDIIHYVGSFSRWKFGETDDKGFYIVSKDDDGFHNKFIINSYAEKYDDIYFYENDPIYSNEDELVKRLSNISDQIGTGIYDNVKLRFQIPENYDGTQFLITFLKSKYEYNSKVKIEVTQLKETKKRKQEKETLEENSKYNIIFDKSIPIEEKIKSYIEMEFDKKIETADICECLDITNVSREC